MELDVAVIGAGLFGSICAQALAAAGRSVTVFDDAQPEAGSTPAACLMRPSWLTSMGKPVVDASLELLDRLYGVQTLKFVTQPKLMSVSVYWVPPSSILGKSRERGSVKRLSRRDEGWVLHFRTGNEVDARTVVVAAGIWTSLLIPEVKQKPLAGLALLWSKAQIDAPFIRPWAPYKQIVGFNRGDGAWVGDGSAILRSNWNERVAAKVESRCDVLNVREVPQRLFGIRPYHDRKPCFIEQVKPGLWVATGGAKNGTLAAGWCAHEIVRQM